MSDELAARAAAIVAASPYATEEELRAEEEAYERWLGAWNVAVEHFNLASEHLEALAAAMRESHRLMGFAHGQLGKAIGAVQRERELRAEWSKFIHAMTKVPE